MKTFTPSSKNSLPYFWRFIMILGNTRTTRHNYWSSCLWSFRCIPFAITSGVSIMMPQSCFKQMNCIMLTI